MNIDPITHPQTLLFGAGGHALEVFSLFGDALHTLGMPCTATWVDEGFAGASKLAHLREITTLAPLAPQSWRLLPAVKHGAIRKRATHFAAARGIALTPPLVHPTAFCAVDAALGDATTVFPMAHVSTRARVGRCCIVHAGAIVTHECRLGDFCFIGPNATLCGGVEVHECAFIGAGATLLPGVVVGARALVGAGTVVDRDVAADAVVRR